MVNNAYNDQVVADEYSKLQANKLKNLRNGNDQNFKHHQSESLVTK